MAALTARRCNPVIRPFAELLADQGKSFKVILTACMRKLLIILNAIIRDQQIWTPKKFKKTLDCKHSRFAGYRTLSHSRPAAANGVSVAIIIVRSVRLMSQRSAYQKRQISISPRVGKRGPRPRGAKKGLLPPRRSALQPAPFVQNSSLSFLIFAMYFLFLHFDFLYLLGRPKPIFYQS